MGSVPTEVKRNFFFTLCGSLILITRANAQWVLSTLIYTSELILCSAVCVHSATRHNIRKKSIVCLTLSEKRTSEAAWVVASFNSCGLLAGGISRATMSN